MKQVEIVYTGRSGRFTKDKVYSSTWKFVGRGGSKSPSTWLFTLNGGHRNYRVTPYEFKKYWKFKDPSRPMVLLLWEVYSDDKDYMKNLVYKTNPFLSMIPKGDQYSGAYIPVPIKYS